MRWSLALFLAWIICFPAAAGETIVLSQRDNLLARSAFAIASEAYRRIGITAKAKVLPSLRALQEADSGETDGELARTAGIEAQYPNLIQVPEPLLNFDTVAFTTGLTFKVDGWESLRPYSLCISRGMKLAEDGTEGMNRYFTNDVPQMIKMLLAGRCQIGILGYVVWPEIDRLQAQTLRSLEPPIVSTPLYLYVNKKHARHVQKLAAELLKMQKDGATAALLSPFEKEIQAARQRNEMLAK
jgi:polar amino acid transport system substrate-binding protein